jgi:hypothetical protein
MKKLILLVFALFFISSANLLSQEISIYSIFTHDTVFFPFENIESISEMTIEGEVTLSHDTSLVRVIVEDDFGVQNMIFEAYPLIYANTYISFAQYCDETCFLDLVNPYSIIIQVIDASLNLKKISYTTEAKENCEAERYNAKRLKDASKIATMNQLIPSYDMNWISGDNGIVAKYYEQKRHMFGDGYNLCGFDYYAEGVFEFVGLRDYPKVDPDLVKHFDWRERHGANIPSSDYWDGDVLGTGWLTAVKDQDPYGTCWAFSAAGLVETITNLYANEMLDYDLSEQNLISCSGAGTCSSGRDDEALGFIKDAGIVIESCFPYDTVNCPLLLCDSMCSSPGQIFKFYDTIVVNSDNHDSIRLSLINSGPLSISYDHPNSTRGGHSVNLIGYNFDVTDSTTIWFIKNSWGLQGWGTNGIGAIKISDIWWATGIQTPVYRNDTVLAVNCWDLDEDSICFWGIGERPANCPCYCDTIEDCDDNDSLVGGYDENYNCSCNLVFETEGHHIDSVTYWSDTVYVNYQVIIDSGACLTISSYAAFSPEAGIQVRQGGKLILDSAYLTKACPDLWKGIEVWGSDTVQGFDEYFGKIVMQNHAIIEFAKIGIANHCVLGYNNSLHIGGIIVAHHSIFRDNETDVLFAPFRNEWLGNELPYEGSFVDCQFITTDNFYPDHLPKAHIEMKDIYGVMIYGSRFGNQSDTAYHFPIRGTGIFSIDSYFMINPYCLYPNTIPCQESDTCTFSRLEYAIKAMNSISKRTLNIQGLKFDTNLVAISLSGLEYASVLSNKFYLPKNIEGVMPNRFIGGLFMEGCTGYHIEGNYFFGEINPMVSPIPANGIGIKNSGPENNEIYNNGFQKVNTGIISIGENRGQESGLCLKCNDNIGNVNDFVVVEDDSISYGIQGINRYQGDPNDSISNSAPAGNTFSNEIGNVDSLLIKKYNYYNSAEDIYYTHHYHEDIRVKPMENHYTSSTIELKGWTYLGYEKETACPSGLGGGGSFKSYSSPRSMINEADIQLDILKTQLNALVDGGNTEALNFEVMTSMPDDGLEIRQQLLNTSPYLSDTVIKQAIYKEDVLPNAMIRDILEANPQSAKSSEILNTLDSRYEPIPDYMMAQILQGKKYLGAKEVLEAKIQSWEKIRSKAKADLMREFLLDTNIISPLDSVITFLENETYLDSKYDLALAQWDNSDAVGAWETVNTIPSQFALNEKQSVDHENYLDYFDVLQIMADSNWQACQLDSASVSLLFDLKESGCPRITALARGLLVKGRFFNYIETVYLPDLTKSSKIHPYQYPEKTTNFTKEELLLFPNPAGDFVIVYYNLDSKNKSGEIHIIDLKGNLLRKYYIKRGKDQIVVDLKGYPNGPYLISLNSRNQILTSKRLIKGGH